MNYHTGQFKKSLLSILILAWSGFILFKFYHFSEFTYLPDLLKNLFSWPKVSLLIEYLWTLVILAAFIFQNIVIGNLFLVKTKINPASQLIRYLLSFGLGVTGWAYLTFFLGLVGFLDPLLFKLIFWLLTASCILLITRKKELFPLAALSISAVKGLFSKICLWLIVLAAIFNLIGALGPEIHYDALFYHLALPAAYQLQGRIINLPFNSFSFLPQNMEMLYLFSLIVNNDLLARLLHWLMGIGAMLSVYVLGRRFFSLPVAMLAATCFYLIPQVGMESWTAMNDLGVVFFVMLSWFCVLEWLALEKYSPSYFYLAAVFTGFALGMKYTAFPIVVISLLYYLRQSRRIPGPFWQKVKPIIWYGLIIGLFLLPWLARNVVFSGSAFAPFTLANFKLATYLDDCQHLNNYHLRELLLGHWQEILNERSLDSLIGPLFLVALPLLVVLFSLSRRQPAIKKAGLFLLVYYVLWRSQTSSWRFFLPALPVFCLLISSIVYSIKIDPFSRKLLLGIFLLIFYGNLGILILALQQKQSPAVLSGAESRETYLTNSHMFYSSPSFAAISFLNQKISADTLVLFIGETRSYYAHFRAIANTAFDQPTFQVYFKNATTAGELAKKLQQDGIGYILFNEGELQRMQAQYKMYDFSRQDILLLQEFWSKHSRTLYYKDGVGIYQVI
ncbi:MAG: glycosyltransferase family 39 protein [bacterium]|nr:glycosyltransferase family 39 protein [bacterium]